jgi:hypothetical protein
MPAALHAPIIDLTLNDCGDVSLWIGRGKQYCNVPEYVSKELCHHTSALPMATLLLPSPRLSVIQLLDFPTPQVTPSLKGIKAEAIFSHTGATHTSSECLQLPTPSHRILEVVRACAGQAMLDGKTSVQHWDKSDVFLPFNALGTWDLILEADTANKAWRDALMWLDRQHEIPTQYVKQVTNLLGTVPWKDHVKGLGLGLSIMDMTVFLSHNWLLDSHIDSMLRAVMYLHRDALSHITPHTEIILTDFITHILTLPLLQAFPIPCDYAKNVPKSVQRLRSLISESPSDIRIATVSFSPPGHWACLIIDYQAQTISWGDSAGQAAPDGLEKCLKAFLGFFSPQIEFSALQALHCAHQTDSYSCGVIAVNTLKHNIFGDELWSESHRESLRIAEFLDILEISESHRASVSTSISML